jgi:hypothetical protein
MIIDFTNFLTQMIGLSKLMVLSWARQVVNLFYNRINLREWVIPSGE